MKIEGGVGQCLQDGLGRDLLSNRWLARHFVPYGMQSLCVQGIEFKRLHLINQPQ